jgi:hypothetical protein
MALPFRSIFGLADEPGNKFDPGLDSGHQDRGAGIGMAHADGMFTVEAESLSEAIPPELKSGVSTHAARVALRLEGAQWEPGEVEVTTRLSHIYRACPQLFAVAIDDDLDVPVRLRLAGAAEPVAGGGEESGSASSAPAVPQKEAAPVANPFRSSAASAVMAQAPMNPFSNPLVKPIDLPSGPPPLPAASIQSPFQVAPAAVAPATPPSAPPLPATPPPVSPFLAALTGAPAAKVGPKPETAAIAPEIPMEGEERSPKAEVRLSFPFHVLLGGIDSAELGINASALPLTWNTHLPWSFLKPQFSTGRVVAPLAKLLEYADAPAKVGLQGLNGGIEVVIPLKEIVRQLPASEGVPESVAVAVEEKPVMNPFAAQVQEEVKRGFVPLKEAPPVLLDPTAPPVSPFRIASETVPSKPVQPEEKSTAKLESLDDLTVAPVETVSAPPPVEAVPVAAAVPTPPAPPIFAVPPVEAVAPEPVSKPSPSPAPAASAVGAGGGESGWLRFEGIGFPSGVRDLELRAVFGRTEPFTRQLALDLTTGLPGVLGCVLFAVSDGAEILARSGGSVSSASAMITRLPKMYQRIRGLAEDLGLESGETATVRTSQGLVSFFAQGSACLGVLQSGEGSDAGFFERLMLIARGVASLRE